MDASLRGVWKSSWALALLAAIIIPVTLPLVLLALPLAAMVGLFWLSSLNRGAQPEQAADDGATLSEQPASIAAKASSQSPRAAPSAPSPEPRAPPPPPPPVLASATPPAAPAARPVTGTSSKGAAGGAAILARLRAQREAKAAAKSRAKRLTVLYASQTGTAAEIAKSIHAEAEARGVRSQVASMNEFGFDNLSAEKTPVVVLVASSTGDGDAPDNSAKFYAAARRRSNAADRLAGVTATTLGLGDSNYTRYMAVPRALRTRFADMGADTFYPGVDADEVDGLEEVVDAWLAGLWPALLEATQGAAPAAEGIAAAAAAASDGGVPPLPRCRVQLRWLEGAAAEAVRAAEAAGPSEAEESARDGSGMYSPEAPFWAPLSAARELTTPASDADRKVLHVELDVSGSGMEYAPGDSIGVLPCNSESLVDRILARLGADPAAVLEVGPAEAEPTTSDVRLLPHLRWPCTLRAALLRGCDLTTPPRKSLLRVLAEHCRDAEERRRLLTLCSRDGREAYAADILAARPSLLDLLNDFPSCRPPLDALLDALPALPPRLYSISCSPLEAPGRVQAAFTVVQYPTARGQRDGVATSWLHRLCAPALEASGGVSATAQAAPRLPVFLRRGGDFRPPADLAAPWVLIGPGTGVAPFRGFLQERRARLAAAQDAAAAAGPCWLYFGCRRADQDYLYQNDFQAFLEDGTLSRLEVAFSRAQAEKVYVQHLMAAAATELRELLVARRGYVFVCGDGAAMAKDVHAALVAALAGGEEAVSEAAAAEMLAGMAREGRYVRDIWS